jgi:hypothetical protein
MIDTTPPDFGLYIWWGSNTRSFYLDHSTARGYTQEWQGEFSWTREYSWDGAPFQVINYSQGWGWYTPDFSRPTDHGTHTLYFKGTDALGNTQTKSYTIVDPTYISTSGQPITTEELHLISPSQNQQVLTNKPTFTWKIPTTSILLTDKNYKIELKKDVADTETRFTLPDKEINPLSLEIKTSTANQLSYTLSWKDTLTPGSWLWQVSDISNKSNPILSPAGSFEVIPALEIEGVINYPNPFKHKTKIRYKLAKDVDELIIRIFTVSGGLVRELSGDTSGSSLSAEYHDVEWDGCNEYGEAVLNGVYRYKVIAKTASEHKETSGKMIKLR